MWHIRHCIVTTVTVPESKWSLSSPWAAQVTTQTKPTLYVLSSLTATIYWEIFEFTDKTTREAIRRG